MNELYVNIAILVLNSFILIFQIYIAIQLKKLEKHYNVR